jgi:TolB-like protein
MMKKSTFRIVYSIIAALLAGVLMAGCSGPRVYIHPNPGLDSIKRIAVLPFGNFSKDDKAGDKVRANFVIELLRTARFNVMDIGETDRLLQIAELSYTTSGTAIPGIGAAQTAEAQTAASEPLSKKIGEALKVEAIFVGSVEAYSTERVSDRIIPEVGISARLIDAETGIIIWASTHSRRGGAGFPILGWGKVTSLSVLSQQVIQDMVNSLAKYAR